MRPAVQRITVFIVDGQRLFREGITLGLSHYQDIEVIGGCASTFDVSSLIKALSPNIVLLSIDDPFLTGIDIGRMIATRFPETAVIALTSNPADDKLLQAIKAGAAAYMSKDVSSEELVDTIRMVAQGKRPIANAALTSPTVVEQVLHQFQDIASKRNDMNTGTSLTSREMDILRYVSEGNSNKQIAYALDICEQTVKNHISNIMDKLQANDRTHAVVLAIRSGWLSVQESEEKTTVS